MKCSACHQNNPQNALYCMKCGIGERWWEAELFRLRGVLLLQQSKPDTKRAEANFLKALEVARRQHTNMLELRAAISLYRFGRQQGKHNNAHQLLVEIYNRFTEGFETPDLKEAKDLIEPS